MKYFLITFFLSGFLIGVGQKTEKPPLHGKHWMAITGKPLGAESGAQIFQQGGNAVDAACAMLASMCTQWAVLSWGGETQAIIYNPKTKKVISIDALGVAPGAATAAYYRSRVIISLLNMVHWLPLPPAPLAGFVICWQSMVP